MVYLPSQIAQNLEIVQNKISRAANISGRTLKDVNLVVVSKAQPLAVVRAAYQSGVRTFGENYPQEAEKKIVELSSLRDIDWHMIGHLQSRKLPVIVSHFQYIHSIDRLNLAEKLDKALAEKQKILPGLIEVNISEEESKSGWLAANPDQWENLLPDFFLISVMKNLIIKGFMAMPPYFENPEMARPYFEKLRKLRDFLNTHITGIHWTELSMGTSGDFEVAVEEGATFVRIGQAILGPRPVN